MPQLHTLLHFHLTPIVMINGSSRRDLIFIRSALGYPAFTVGTITGTPEVRPSQSSRTRERSSQCSNARTGYGPNCLTTF
ncbi:hypothetical protein LUZ60_006015 [Juncus effusus]|nr:hypothetical protein LUZ60_006015 [Juncus effusus]